jgi:hypothetical protein
MFDVIDGLRGGIDAAERRISDAQTAVARANAGGRSADAAMAQSAEAAIFDEALLSSLRARLVEIKAVTR